MSQQSEFILTVTCAVGRGIVAAVAGFLAEQQCYISELEHFDDRDRGLLFLRAQFFVEEGPATLETLDDDFATVASAFDMQYVMRPQSAPMRTLMMVSQYDHCFNDLIYRQQKGELNMVVTAVVSNHQKLRPLAEREGFRFIHLPITKDNKSQQEQALLDVIQETGTELVVLARYMQILSNSLCSAMAGRVINIHHSFLPGFKGAKPYHQAYERGVKLIGATAHYATADLDEGPIIEQSVIPVNHTDSANALVSIGRDVETRTLAAAVKLHTEHRVFVDGNKTVIFKS